MKSAEARMWRIPEILREDLKFKRRKAPAPECEGLKR
jgi:hypothetical protein